MLRYTLIDHGDIITDVMISRPNTMVRLIESALGERLTYVNAVEDADVAILGPYGNEKMSDRVRSSRAWKLFVTGENVEPNFAFCDASLSFKEESHQGKNFRFPVWMLELNWFEDVATTFTREETEYLLTKNRPLGFDKQRFLSRRPQVIAVFNAFEHHRFEVARRLIEKKCLIGVGRPFGNENKWAGGFYREKCNILSQYICNMCFENTLAKGYITEKPLHARAMGTLPLVFCDPQASDFNWSAALNLADYSSIREFIELTQFYISNQDLLFEKLNTPIFQKIPDIKPVISFIRDAYERKFES